MRAGLPCSDSMICSSGASGFRLLSQPPQQCSAEYESTLLARLANTGMHGRMDMLQHRFKWRFPFWSSCITYSHTPVYICAHLQQYNHGHRDSMPLGHNLLAFTGPLMTSRGMTATVKLGNL